MSRSLRQQQVTIQSSLVKCKSLFKTKGAQWMHEKWCKQEVASEEHILFSNSSEKSEEHFGAIAKSVVENLVTKIVQNEEESVNALKKERSSYDSEFKLKVINEVKGSTLALCDVAQKHGIHKSLVTKWKQDEKRIISHVAEGKVKKLMKKGRPSNKHQAVFVKLRQKFVKARSLGMKVSYAWVYVDANKINAELNSNAPRVPKSAAMRFIKKYSIKLRRVQRKKQVRKEGYEEKIMAPTELRCQKPKTKITEFG